MAMFVFDLIPSKLFDLLSRSRYIFSYAHREIIWTMQKQKFCPFSRKSREIISLVELSDHPADFGCEFRPGNMTWLIHFFPILWALPKDLDSVVLVSSVGSSSWIASTTPPFEEPWVWANAAGQNWPIRSNLRSFLQPEWCNLHDSTLTSLAMAALG